MTATVLEPVTAEALVVATRHSLVLLAFRPKCITNAPTTTQPRGSCVPERNKDRNYEHDIFGLPPQVVPKTPSDLTGPFW